MLSHVGCDNGVGKRMVSIAIDPKRRESILELKPLVKAELSLSGSLKMLAGIARFLDRTDLAESLSRIANRRENQIPELTNEKDIDSRDNALRDALKTLSDYAFTQSYEELGRSLQGIRPEWQLGSLCDPSRVNPDDALAKVRGIEHTLKQLYQVYGR